VISVRKIKIQEILIVSIKTGFQLSVFSLQFIVFYVISTNLAFHRQAGLSYGKDDLASSVF
ncbi:unnamed protein product, partial [marine sediment metagenome]